MMISIVEYCVCMVVVKFMIECWVVQKYYGDYYVLCGIDLIICEGEFFLLLGLFGCGKIMFLCIIVGFEDIIDGVVLIDGQNMENVLVNCCFMNMVFQFYVIFLYLIVVENVVFGLCCDL